MFIKNLNIMNALQLLGRSLMLPIAVLPIAGIMLRIGQPDLLNITAISAAGSAIFENLALIFAIGVAIGIANDNHGAAALGGATAFLILNGTLKTLNNTINTGVLGGIICGIIAGSYYNRFKNIHFPEYLAFFGGRRFIPIISGFTALILAYLFKYIWPPIQAGMDYIGLLMVNSGSIGLFFYGFINRLLIVTGLHHILNNLVWFQFGSFTTNTGEVVHGDLSRFFMGDPTAGSFMAGMFPIMMFGLPAVALAIYRSAPRAQRPLIGGMLFSVAFTSFLTGITEPIEFSFMFLAPALYSIHAFLTGLSMVVMGLLNVKLGFTFSAGTFDYLLSYGKSTNGWLLIPVGIIFFIIYYSIFSWVICRFKLNLAVNEAQALEQEDKISVNEIHDKNDKGAVFVAALGGVQNLSSIGACTTRLRLIVKDQAKIDEAKLKQLGAKAVVKRNNGNVQVILGPIADNIAENMRQYIRSSPIIPSIDSPAVNPERKYTESFEKTSSQQDRSIINIWLTAMGGIDNIKTANAVATTRLRLELVNGDLLHAKALKSLGIAAIQRVGDNIVHLVFTSEALPKMLAMHLLTGVSQQG